jgi:hypothetical protein
MLYYLDILLEHLFLFIYGTALILALFRYPMYFDTPLKYYPILLMYTFINETFGYLIKINTEFNPIFTDWLSNNTMIFYNIFNLTNFLYFIYIFQHFSQNRTYKKIISILGLFFFIISFINIFIESFLYKIQTYSYIAGGLIIIYCSIIYLKQNRGVIRKKIAKQSLLYWISIGLLIFYIGYLPIKTYYALSSFENTDLYYHIRRMHITLVGIMYSFISYGFIQMKGKLKI